MVSYTKRLEKQLAASDHRNKELASDNRILRYKNRLLREELQFAKDIFLKSVKKAAEK